MAKYRRIPKEIEAIVFDKEEYFKFKQGKEVQDGLSEFFKKIEYFGHSNNSGYFKIMGTSYNPTILEGDYLILNEDGSIFVLDEQAFKNVYEEIT